MAPDLTARPRDSAWVEFVGLPGAGKSEVSRAVAKVLRARRLAVFEPSYELDHATPPAERRSSKLWLAVRAWAQSPRQSRFWLRTLVRSRQESRRRLGDAAINWFYLLGSAQRCAGVPGIHVFDQGLLQALWSIGYAARRAEVVSPELLGRLTRALPRRAIVVFVDADLRIIRNRLTGRVKGRSLLERDLTNGHAAACLAKATQILLRVEEIAWQLAHVHDAVVVRVNSDTAGSLPTSAAVIVDAIEELLI